ETNFSVVNTKSDFEIIRKIQNKEILCFYSAQHLPDDLQKNIITARKGEVFISEKSEDVNFKALLESKMIYILLQISLSKNSETNYLEDEEIPNELHQKIESLKIYRGNSLEQKIFFGNDEVSSTKMYA